MTTQPIYRRKLIEVDLPLDEINKQSKRERAIRHGHPSTLHQWWARLSLAACRAVIFASMVDDPSSCEEEFPTAESQDTERNRLHNIIRHLVNWETTDETNPQNIGLLAEARWEIARSVARSRGEAPPDKANPDEVLRYLGDKALPIYDPFCGGGSIPLEAQRLGLQAVGSDLNPVAVLITKTLIELPPKFANKPPVNPDADPMGMTVGKGKKAQKVAWRGAAGLADDIRYYGRKMREMAWERIGHLYPKAKLPDGGEATVIAWLWARTVPCPNPACRVEMPLTKTFQLSTKQGNQHWTRPVVDRDTKLISFVVQNHRGDVPKESTVDRNGATCIACNGTVPLSYVREQSRAGHLGEQMTAIVAEGDRKRLFLSPTDEHIKAAMLAKSEWRPGGSFPNRTRDFTPSGYGITYWHQLFKERQLVALTTLSELVAEVGDLFVNEGVDKGYSNAICTYLALAVDRKSNAGSKFSTWQNAGDFVSSVFKLQALPMVWDFAEINPFSGSTNNWMAQIEWIARITERLPAKVNSGIVHQADASTTVHANEGPVIVTDPPYYDNVAYADLSDFFYVWLRPMLRGIYPGLFAGIATPKSEEMIAEPSRFEHSRDRFEALLNQTLQLIRERCGTEFPSSIFYAYKQQEEEREGRTSTGWETMLSAVVSAGFQIVGTWPMRTAGGRVRAVDSNALASSVVIVCRPRLEDAPNATRRQFLDALEAELPQALDQLTQESHIAPVDLAQAAIGPGMQVYSRYSRVETIGGELVPVREALVNINRVIAEYDELQQGDLDAPTRFCLDWFKQNDYNEGRFGEAEDLARAKNVSVEELRDGSGLLTAGAGVVKLLPLDQYGPERSLRLGDMTAWEGCFRMTYHLDTNREDGGGVEGAATVARAMGSNAESVERLARILYNHYDRKGDSRNSVMFNNLVTEWPNIQARAQGPEEPTLL